MSSATEQKFTWRLLSWRPLYRSIGAVVAALICAQTLVAPAAAQKRLALVIGNSAYQHTSPLANPESDARLMAQALRRTGFEVLEHSNLGFQAMRRAFAAYTTKLKANGQDSIGLIFYAGHGLQVKGLNYMLPVDARIEKEADVDIEAIDASSLMRSISHIGNRLNIIVLDACRNNPYRSRFRSAATGLARMDAPIGSLVAFSTAPGMVAADGATANSPYTTSLARRITQPGLKLEDVFKRVRNDVFKTTEGAQVPWESSSIFSDFYFAEGKKPKKTAPAAANQAERAWSAIQATNSAAVLRAYIARFPKSVYAAFAEARLKELSSKTAALRPQPKPAATSPEPNTRAPADNRLRVLFAAGGKPYNAKGVRWDVYEPTPDRNGKRKRVTYSYDAQPLFKLADGRYFVRATLGNASASGKIEVRADKPWGRHFVMNAGVLRTTASLAPDGRSLKKDLRWHVYHAELDDDDKRKRIAYSYDWRPKFVLPPGRYHIVVVQGAAQVARDVVVQAGQSAKQAFVLNAGRLTFTSSLVEGGPRLKRSVRWNVYRAELDDDDRRERVAYSHDWRPRFVLKAGNYIVTAVSGNASASKEVTVTAGKADKHAIVFNAGRLIVSAALSNGSGPLRRGLRYDIYNPEKDQDGNLQRVAYSSGSARANFTLPAGRYLVQATHGNGVRSKVITIAPGKLKDETIVLQAGRIKLTAKTSSGDHIKGTVSWRVFDTKKDFDGHRKQIAYGSGARPIVTLNAGTYLLVLTKDKLRSEKTITVAPGDQKVIDMTFN